MDDANPILLLILSSIMAISSFLAGILPLSLSLSSRQLRIVTQLGSGLLIGTALIIIIPEGISTVYSSSQARDGHDGSHNKIGFGLITGFLLMYLIDTIPPIFSRGSISRDEAIPLTTPPSSPSTSPSGQLKSSSAALNATTVGLIIHAFADGIALGASSAHPSSVGLIVFAAIMLHKAPAAFGLTTQLLKQGLSKREARGHLVLFSLAAPVGAFVTWFAVRAFGGGNAGDGGFWTGMALVFSGGTFL
jgi:solute carrier family 39 (zinc transporter), member 9